MVAKAYWLASYPKSGNTWLRMFLNAYWLGITDINRMMLTVGDISPPAIQQVLSTPLDVTPRPVILRAREVALYNLMVQGKTSPTIFKTHNANVEIEGVRLVPPSYTDGVIYIVRNPFSIVPSLSKHMNTSIEHTISNMADTNYCIGHPADNGYTPLQHVLHTWSEHVLSWVDATDIRVHVVRYEDLKQSPEEEFSKILDFMSIEGTHEELETAIKATELTTLQEQELKKGFAESPAQMRNDRSVFFGGTKDWKEVLTDTQMQKIILDHGAVMKRFGYLET